MSAVYEPENFAARVSLAASYISAGRSSTRAFDTCFEMYDGNAVALALYRRTLKNPDGALARNIWNYLGRDHMAKLHQEHAAETNLAAFAGRLRAQSEAYNRGWHAYTADLRARPTYHDGAPRKQWHELSDLERESWIKNPTPRKTYRTELTPEGEQAVIPGCERDTAPSVTQLDLF